MEATHILVPENDKNHGDHTKTPENIGSELQDVIRYLRRSKEAVSVGLSLSIGTVVGCVWEFQF